MLHFSKKKSALHQFFTRIIPIGKPLTRTVPHTTAHCPWSMCMDRTKEVCHPARFLSWLKKKNSRARYRICTFVFHVSPLFLLVSVSVYFCIYNIIYTYIPMHLSFHMRWNKTMYHVCTKPTGVLCPILWSFGTKSLVLGIY